MNIKYKLMASSRQIKFDLFTTFIKNYTENLGVRPMEMLLLGMAGCGYVHGEV
jgi:uncharacterized OsmC-like protein